MKSKHDIDNQACPSKESATYRIRILGGLDERWSDCLGGMSISANRGEDHEVVTTLIGQLRDQAALVGVINTLYDMHLPILLVECLGKDASVPPPCWGRFGGGGQVGSPTRVETSRHTEQSTDRQR